ncbi:hypothetical protein [Burkholderia sp. D-99]|uniref:hypothetical protein n=1 Tax=Burkholderia sp. D-99 TaxID=2717316 RepID=UPI00141F2E3B|nr:hypothetical protein [Burkholderia sp. D-99]NHV28415.1 hypothetical protein [Burkholderia sp. D-99]
MIQHNLTFGPIGGGPARWNVVTSPLEGSAKNDGGGHPDHGLRREIADDARSRYCGALPGAALRDHAGPLRRANRYATAATA